MAKKLESDDLVRQVYKLALGKSNDAVRLVFLDPDNREEIKDLDLRMVSEVKRGSAGAVEVKLINRIALLELLAKLLEPQEISEKGTQAESFYSAMDKAAARLGESNEI